MNNGRGRGQPTASSGLLLLATLLLASCSAAAPLPTPTATPPPTVMPSPTATPTRTATPTPTPSPTPEPTPTPSPTPVPLEAEVAVQPLRVVQGHTAAITVACNQPCLARVVWSDSEVLLLADEAQQHHVGLLGVAAIAAPGWQALRIAVEGPGGTLTLLGTLEVAAGDYLTESLTFTPEVSQLLRPEITQPERERVEAVFARYTPAVLWSGAFEWPLESRVTSPFGSRRMYGDQLSGYHAGIDLAGDTGTPVHAPAAGIVALADALQVRGNAVILDHGLGVLSGYFHLDEVAVAEGQEVARGDLLGTVGATGLVTGSHLHWELRVGGVPVSPTEWTERIFP